MGLWREAQLVVLPERSALALADDYRVIFGLTTYGDARQASLKRASVPWLDEGEDDSLLDTDAYNPRSTSAYDSDDWPPHVGTYALEDLPEDLDDLVKVADSMPSSPYVYLEPADEDVFVQNARDRGYRICRDDGLFAQLRPGSHDAAAAA